MTCSFNNRELTAPGGTLLETDFWVLEHSADIQLPGLLILKTRRHLENVSRLSREEAMELGPLIKRAASACQKATGADRIYVLSFGETVRHVHFWLLPRTSAIRESLGYGPSALSSILQYYRQKPADESHSPRVRGAIRRIRSHLGTES